MPSSTPIVPIGPSFQQSLFCLILWFWSCFTQNLLYWRSLHNKIFQNSHWFLNYGHSVIPHPFWKKIIIIIFSTNIKVFKNHASIRKLGAFNHASFIFKKRKRKKKRSSSSSFQKKKKIHDFQKSCIHF